jgi:peptide/nickel transport system permease protein
MPEFRLGLLLILLFAYHAPLEGWPVRFPASGTRSPGYEVMDFGGRLADRLYHLVLPVTTLSLVLTAGVSRYVRGSMLEVIRQDFVRTARAKGLPERSVIWKHALRNALTPVITQLGLYLPVLFGGTVLIEAVFGWPGMGKIVVDAIGERDQPVILAGSLIFALMVVLANLVADILYALVDPRIRYD